ncbi:hypothetical protein [Streptomyces sp. NPDC059122]
MEAPPVDESEYLAISYEVHDVVGNSSDRARDSTETSIGDGSPAS